MKIVHFFGWDNKCESPITEWIDKILPIYVLRVSSHFWPFTKVNLVLVNFNKHWDWVRPLPPSLGQMLSKRICFLKAPLIHSIDIDMCVEEKNHSAVCTPKLCLGQTPFLFASSGSKFQQHGCLTSPPIFSVSCVARHKRTNRLQNISGHCKCTLP